jgi:hypothetical protein
MARKVFNCVLCKRPPTTSSGRTDVVVCSSHRHDEICDLNDEAFEGMDLNAWNALGELVAGLEAKAYKVKPEWVVNDMGELGVKIGDRFFFLYKGKSLEYDDPNMAIQWRPVEKREFGECCHPVETHAKAAYERYRYEKAQGKDQVRYDYGDSWAPLPTPKVHEQVECDSLGISPRGSRPPWDMGTVYPTIDGRERLVAVHATMKSAEAQVAEREKGAFRVKRHVVVDRFAGATKEKQPYVVVQALPVGIIDLTLMEYHCLASSPEQALDLFYERAGVTRVEVPDDEVDAECLNGDPKILALGYWVEGYFFSLGEPEKCDLKGGG